MQGLSNIRRGLPKAQAVGMELAAFGLQHLVRVNKIVQAWWSQSSSGLEPQWLHCLCGVPPI